MEKNTKQINLSIVEDFRKAFPDLDIKTPKWAAANIASEFRQLKVGEIVLFPLEAYKYTTVRTAPGGSLVNERLVEGRRWKVKLDHDNISAAVIRLA